MKKKFFISIIIFTFVFVAYGFAQEQTAIEKTMQEIQQASPEEIKEKAQQIYEQALEQVPEQAQQQAAGTQDMNIVEIEGTINKIAEDGSSIVVDEANVITNSELLANSNVKEGDRIIMLAAITNEGIQAVSINLAKEEEKAAADSELLAPEQKESEETVLEEVNQEDKPIEETSLQEESTETPAKDIDLGD